MTNVNCPSCIKLLVDIAFEVEGQMTQSTATRDCPRCGKRWTVIREDDPPQEKP